MCRNPSLHQAANLWSPDLKDCQSAYSTGGVATKTHNLTEGFETVSAATLESIWIFLLFRCILIETIKLSCKSVQTNQAQGGLLRREQGTPEANKRIKELTLHRSMFC